MEMLKIILSSGIWTGIMAILLAVIQRKWKKSDDKEDMIKALVTAQKVMMVDRVRHLGQSYINNGEISLEDKETLQDMYSSYKALGGNGHLVTIMAEVDRLPLTRKED